MRSNSFFVRGVISAVLLAPAGGMLWLSSCGSDSSSTGDGDGGCVGLQCLDGRASVDGRASQDDSSAPGTDAANADGASDAAADVDPYADADMNCTHYVTSAGGAPATVKIVNQTGGPIYLGQPTPSCEYYVGFTFKDQADASFALTTSGANDCNARQTGCEQPSCSAPVVTKLADGKTFDIGWPGTVFAQKWMPPSCYADAACVDGPCTQEIAAPDGTVSIAAYTGFYCDGGACADCTVNANGNCTVFSATGVNGTVRTGEASYTKGATTITVNIQ